MRVVPTTAIRAAAALLAVAWLRLAAGDQLPEGHHCAGIVPEVQGAYASASALSNLALGLLPMYLTYDCALSLRNFICLGTFSPYFVPAPAKLCTSVCATVQTACGELFELAKGESALSQITDQLDSCEDTADCVEGNYDVFFEEDLPECPAPLVVPDRDDPDIPVTGTGCAVPCLTPTLTSEEWDIFIEVFKYCSSIGFAASVYMCIKGGWDTVYCADPNRRPASLFVWMFSVGCAVTSLGGLLLIGAGVKENLCRGNATTYTYSPVCVAQGYCYAFGGLFAAEWALCQCFEIYMRVARRATKVTLDYCRKFYPLFLVPIALWSSVFAAATEGIGFQLELSMPSCFFFPYDQRWVQYVAWYGPLLFIDVICFVFMSLTIYEINKVLMRKAVTTLETTNTRKEKRKQIMKIIKFNTRPMLFVFFFVMTSSYLCLIRFSTAAMEDQYQDSTEEFIRCLLEASAETPGDTSKCGDAPEVRVPFGALVVVLVIISCFGMIPMAVYGAEWSRLANCVPLCCRTKLAALFPSSKPSPDSTTKISQQQGVEMGKIRHAADASSPPTSGRASGSLALSESDYNY